MYSITWALNLKILSCNFFKAGPYLKEQPKKKICTQNFLKKCFVFVLQRFLYFQHQFETWHLKYLKKQKRSQKSPTPFLLLLIIVYWRAETQCWSKKSVNFMQVLPNSVNVQTMVHRSIYSFDSDVLHKKGKVVKAFLFNILTLDYDCCKGFVRP